MLEQVGRSTTSSVGRRVTAVGLAVCAAGVVAGCGQTDFATGVGDTRATLNATITRHDAGADERAWFQFWPATTPTEKQRTPRQPVTATGPLSATVTGLAPDTTYRFRLCGRRDTVRACAQTRTFTTSHDAVQAVGLSEVVHTPGIVTQVRDLDVDATAGRPGGRFAARLDLIFGGGGLQDFALGSRTDPNITCLAVSGHVAVVGFRNAFEPPPTQPYLGYGFATLVDGGPVGSGRDLVGAGFGNTASDPAVCPIPTDLSSLLPLERGDVSVNDVSASP